MDISQKMQESNYTEICIWVRKGKNEKLLGYQVTYSKLTKPEKLAQLLSVNGGSSSSGWFIRGAGGLLERGAWVGGQGTWRRQAGPTFPQLEAVQADHSFFQIFQFEKQSNCYNRPAPYPMKAHHLYATLRTTQIRQSLRQTPVRGLLPPPVLKSRGGGDNPVKLITLQNLGNSRV